MYEVRPLCGVEVPRKPLSWLFQCSILWALGVGMKLFMADTFKKKKRQFILCENKKIKVINFVWITTISLSTFISSTTTATMTNPAVRPTPPSPPPPQSLLLTIVPHRWRRSFLDDTFKGTSFLCLLHLYWVPLSLVSELPSSDWRCLSLSCLDVGWG